MPSFLDKDGFQHFVDSRIGHTDYTMLGETISEALMNSGGSRIGVNLDVDASKNITDVVVKATQGDYVLTKPADGLNYVEFAGFRELTPITVTVNFKMAGVDTMLVDSVEVDSYSMYMIDFTLGGDVWDGWLKTSNIKKKFETFEELLADDQAMTVLFANHASVDYFVSWCENDPTLWPQVRDLQTVVRTIGKYDYSWEKIQEIPGAGDYLVNGEYWEYILKDKVPVMTSNTTPEGEVLVSSVYSADTQGYMAFDGKTNTIWNAKNGNNDWITYKFEKPTCIRKIYSTHWGDRIKDWTLLASNTNNDDYIPVASGSCEKGVIHIDETFDNDKYYLYYKLRCIPHNNDVVIVELQFYGRSMLGVPKMTSNTTPEGIASTDGTVYNDPTTGLCLPYKAFDSNTTTVFQCVSKGSPDIENDLQYEFETPAQINSFYLLSREMHHIRLEGFDGENWDAIPIYDAQGNNIENKSFGVGASMFYVHPNKAYKKYKLYAAGAWYILNGYWTVVTELNYFYQDLTDPELVYVDGISVSTWLQKGRWTGAAYTILDDVLADEKCVRQLMTVHDSVDYMVSALAAGGEETAHILSNDLVAKWVNLRDYALDALLANPVIKEIMDNTRVELVGQVPKMTSNTTPYGTVIYNQTYEGSEWRAFDGDGTTWGTAKFVNKVSWYGYTFTEPKCIKQYTLKNNKFSGTYQLQGCNGDVTVESNWENIEQTPNVITTSTDTYAFKVDNDKEYLSYRLRVTTTTSDGGVAFALLQFYAEEYSSKYGYGEWALVGQVPKMTNNTAPYGEAKASSELSNLPAYMAFDGISNSNDKRYSSAANPSEYWLQYKFTEPKRINSAVIQQVATGTTFDMRNVTAKILGSNDGVDFENHVLATFELKANELHDRITVHLNNSKSFLYYRLKLDDANLMYSGQKYITIALLQFYAWQPKGNIPVMTSNNAPYGECIQSSSFSSQFDSWKAFDGSVEAEADHRWTSVRGQNNSYIGYTSVNPINVKRIAIQTFSINQGGTPLDCTVSFEGFDGTEWKPIKSIELYASDWKTMVYHDIPNNDKYYLSHRLVFNGFIVIDNSGNYYGNCAFLQFYGRELKVSVPKMTSNTEPWGEASGVDEPSGYEAFRAFDKDKSKDWWSNRLTNESSLTYKFKSPVVVKFVTMLTRFQDYVTSVKIQASNDNFTTIGFESDVLETPSPSTEYGFELSNNEEFEYYRIKVLTGSIPNYVNITEANFFGFDYSEREFEQGSNMKFIYDHGIEFEELYLYHSIRKPDCFNIGGNGQGGTAPFVTTLNSIKLNDKNRKFALARTAGHFYNGDQNKITIAVCSTKEWSTWIGYGDCSPTEIYYNIESYAENHIGMGWGGQKTYDVDITEFWLE